MPDVDFFFDYSCPWTYLAYTRFKETATRTGARIVWRPILLDDLFEQVNPALKADRRDPDPRRAKYQDRDLDRVSLLAPGAAIHSVQLLGRW